MIETDLRRGVSARAQQFLLFVRELKIIAKQITDEIAKGAVKGVFLVQKQNSLVQVRQMFLAWPYGSLTDVNVRARLVEEYPDVYANVAAVATETSAVNQAFIALQAALEVAIATARAAGQLIDSDPVTGVEMQMELQAAEVADLLAAAAAVRDSIAGAA